MRKLLHILPLLLILSACFKEEDPRAAFTNFETIPLGNDYENQFFYSLEDTSIVSSNDYKDWNLAFYAQDDNYFIRLNAAANMWAIKTASYNFDDVFSSLQNESSKRFDGSHGLTNSLALDMQITFALPNDTTFTEGRVYLIHPGIESNGNDIGAYKKFVWEGVYNGAYLIRYANLDGSNERRLSIPKDDNVNFVCYSFFEDQVKNIEPDNSTWDLLFTRFTDTVYTNDGSDFLIGYAVTGAYLNQNSVEAYLEESIAYEDFNYSNIDFNKMSAYLNVIGHDWKQFNDQYYIYKNKLYIIKDRKGNYYKLRFLSFYDSDTGQKGYPSFEFTKL